MALSLPDLSLGVSYGTDAWAAPAYVEEKTRLRRFKCKRGRQHERQKFDTGTSELTLHNRDREVDPTYSGSSHAGQLVPGVRYRLTATWAGITYGLFVNFAERWKPEWPDAAAADVVLTGVDAFKAFNRKDITSAGYEAAVLADTPRAFWRMGDRPGSDAAADSSGNARDALRSGTVSFGADGALFADEDTALAIAGVGPGSPQPGTGALLVPSSAGVSGTGAFSIEGWFQTSQNDGFVHVLYAQLLADGTFDVVVYEYSGHVYMQGPNFTVANGGPATADDGKWHYFCCTRMADGRSVLSVVDDDELHYGFQFAPAAANVGGPLVLIGGTPEGTDVAGQTGVVGSLSGPSFVGSIDEVATYSSDISVLNTNRQQVHYRQGRALWGSQLSGARVGQVLDVVGWPIGDRSIDAGVSVLQPITEPIHSTSVLEHLQLVEASESGLLFIDGLGRVRFIGRRALMTPPYTTSVATFGDGPGEIPYEEVPDVWVGDDVLYPETVVTRKGAGSQRVIDQAASDQYGPATLTIDTILDDDGEAFDLATSLNARYAHPAPRLGSIRVHPTADPATIWPVVLGLEIGQRITFNTRPVPKGTAVFSQVAIVEGIEHEMTEDGDWFVVISCGAADFADYWVLGTSALDVNTRLAF